VPLPHGSGRATAARATLNTLLHLPVRLRLLSAQGGYGKLSEINFWWVPPPYRAKSCSCVPTGR